MCMLFYNIPIKIAIVVSGSCAPVLSRVLVKSEWSTCANGSSCLLSEITTCKPRDSGRKRPKIEEKQRQRRWFPMPMPCFCSSSPALLTDFRMFRNNSFQVSGQSVFKLSIKQWISLMSSQVGQAPHPRRGLLLCEHGHGRPPWVVRSRWRMKPY